MGAFEYVALDARGRERKGALEGDNARQIRQQLRERGLSPLEVTEAAQKENRPSRSRARSRGVGAGDLALVTRQLATLVQSGLPLEEALQAVSQQTEKPRIRNLILAVRARVLEGHPLATGLGDFPRVFPELYRATVAAGEQSGHLDAVLDRLADYTESRQTTRNKIGVALFYPALITGMALIIVTGLLAYIVPQVVQVFEGLGQELPWLTRALIQVSDIIREWGLVIAGAIIICVVLFRRWLRDEKARFRVHKLMLKLPLISSVVRGLNSAQFARTLSILAASGVPVLEALGISSAVLTNRPMRQAVEQAAAQVREGSSLQRALEKSGLFPPMILHLIASGEASGNLDAMLDRAAAHQEREMETTLSVFLGLFEPLIIALMGVVVLIIVLAILLPIFELNQLVR